MTAARRPESTSVARRELIAEVASLYYLGKLDQTEVADRVGVSRSTVSRMLNQAEELGIVEIKVNRSVPIDEHLGEEVVRRFPVRDAVVVPAAPGHGTAVTQVGSVAARYLRQLLPHDGSLGLGWGTSLRAVADAFDPAPELKVDVVQMIGAAATLRPEVDGPGLSRDFAGLLGGRHFWLNAPLIVDEPQLAQALRRQRSTTTVLDLAARVDVALVGLGGLNPDGSLVRAGYVTESEVGSAVAQGAVADVCGVFLAPNGTVTDVDLSRRTIALDVERLRRIPRVIAVASGTEKVAAIAAALRSGLINVLISDAATVTAVLSADESGRSIPLQEVS